MFYIYNLYYITLLRFNDRISRISWFDEVANLTEIALDRRESIHLESYYLQKSAEEGEKINVHTISPYVLTECTGEKLVINVRANALRSGADESRVASRSVFCSSELSTLIAGIVTAVRTILEKRWKLDQRDRSALSAGENRDRFQQQLRRTVRKRSRLLYNRGITDGYGGRVRRHRLRAASWRRRSRCRLS